MLTIGRLERARDWCMFKQSALSAMPLTRYDATAIVCTGILLGIDAIHICDIWCCNRIPKCCHFTHHQHQQQPWWCLVLGVLEHAGLLPTQSPLVDRLQWMGWHDRFYGEKKKKKKQTNKNQNRVHVSENITYSFIYLFIFIPVWMATKNPSSD